MKYVEGNLLDMTEEGKFDIIVHGCNCFNTMGAGIAGQIAKRYPKAFRVDNQTVRGSRDKLGKFTQTDVLGVALRPYGPNIRGMRQIGYKFKVINAYTQYSYSPESKPVDYEAIYNVFLQIKMCYDIGDDVPKIGIPQIGAGLAGGDWSRIERIIDSIGIRDLTCVIFKEN